MKLNWGFGIFIFILLFMAFILGLVYKCSQQKTDLVNEKYYEKELNYQQQVNKLNNTAALDEKLTIQYNKEKENIEILYPSKSGSENLSGEINFFKPDDASLDFKITAQCDDRNRQMVPVSKLKRGWWKIQLSWETNGTPYYKEEKILID